MSKAIMISGKPRWSALIMNGYKTIEFRKNRGLYKAIQELIDKYGFCDIYWCCTKLRYPDNGLFFDELGKRYLSSSSTSKEIKYLNGKVVFKFTVRKAEELRIKQGIGWATETIKGTQEIERKGCVSRFDLYQYCKGFTYAYHIEDSVIFDKPKELSEFKHICPNIMCDECNYADLSNDKCLPICSNQLKRAPQNFCYVESED